MPRYSFSNDGDEQAKAGALTRMRMTEAATDERRYQDTLARQDRLDARADEREARFQASQGLSDEINRWEFAKKKALDENAAMMKIETDKQAIEANKELFQINTADDDAAEKLADWGAKYFRVLDEKTGDPRLIQQFQINQRRAEMRVDLKAKADALRAEREEKLSTEKELAAQRAGYRTVTTDETGAVKSTTTRQNLTPEAAAKADRDSLLEQHNAMEAGLTTYDPGKKEDRVALTRFNQVKQRLGFATLDPETGKPVAAAVPERIATNPKTGERVAYRNGQWVPLTP